MANNVSDKDLERLLLKLTVKIDDLIDQVKRLQDAFEKQPKVGQVGGDTFQRIRTSKETQKFLGCSYQMLKDYTAKGAFKLANGSRKHAPEYDCFQLVDAIQQGLGGKLIKRLPELLAQLPDNWKVELLKSPPVAGIENPVPPEFRKYAAIGKRRMEAQ